MTKRILSLFITMTMILSLVSVFGMMTPAAAEKNVVMLLEDDFEKYTEYDAAEAAGWTCSGTLNKGTIGKDKSKYLNVRTGSANFVYRDFDRTVALQYGSGLQESDKAIVNPGINAKLVAEYEFNSLGFNDSGVTNYAYYGLADNNMQVLASVSTKAAVLKGGYIYGKATVNATDPRMVVPFDTDYATWEQVKIVINITDEKGNFFYKPFVTIYQRETSDEEWIDRTAQWPDGASRELLGNIRTASRFFITSNSSARPQAVDNIKIYLENEGNAVAKELETPTPVPLPETTWQKAEVTPAPQAAVTPTKAVGNISKEEAAKTANAKFMTPNGAGSRDGSSWENAYDGSQPEALQNAVDSLNETGTLYILGGAYKKLNANITKSGKSVTEPIKIVGINDGDKRVETTGEFIYASVDSDKTVFITYAKGASNIHVENVFIKKYLTCFLTAGANSGLRFYNISLENFGDGFYMDGGSSINNLQQNKDIIIDGCDGYWYRKRFIRFRNGNNGVIVSNCHGDAGGKDAWYESNWPVGIGFEDNGFGTWEENITVVDCVLENSYQEPEDKAKYWNGDGVSAERTTRNLTFIRVNCFNATDGGWDAKTVNPVLIDCVAIGNKRGFRFWSSECVTLINCLGAYSKAVGGGSSLGLWTNANVEAYNCTFFNNADAQVEVAEGTARMALYNCIVGYYGVESKLYSIGGSINGIEPQIKYNVAEYPGVDPKFVNMKDEKFYGDNDSWNSTIHNGAVGYHYNPDRKSAAPQVTSDYKNIVDIPSAYSWAKDAIEFMTDKGFMPGWSQTTFGTQYNATRTEFAAMLVRTLALKSDKTPDFKDVLKNNEYYEEIGVAQAIGLIKGDDTGLFRPYDSMTREEMMVMLSRGLKLAGKLANDYNGDIAALNSFSDIDMISEWAKQDIANVVTKEIIKGGTDGTINPRGNTTRAEVAVIGQRIYNMK